MIVLANCLALVGNYNFTCSTNQIALEMKASELDATTFCSNGWETKLGGLKSATVKHSGFADYGVTDAALPSNVGVNGLPVSIAVDNTAGSTAYLLRGLEGSMSTLGKVGDLSPIDGNITSDGAAARGVLALAPSVPSTGALAVSQLGAITAGRRAVAIMHLLGGTGTVSFELQSAATVGFASPTVRASATAAATATWIESSTVTSDAFWRINVTAVTGSPTIALTMGTT